MATNGNPLANVSISLTRAGKATLTAYTSSSGYYYFGDLGQETCIITPSLTGYAFDPNLRETAATGTEMNFTAVQIATQIYGLNFSPYLAGQSPSAGSVVTEDQIRKRLSIVAPYTKWIRTYSMNHGLENIGRIAHELGLKTAIGAWISVDGSANTAEINALISAAKNGYVDLAVIGSEALYRKELTETSLIGYLNYFRGQVPSIPVTTAEPGTELLWRPNVVAACDVLFVNYYPYWNGTSEEKAIVQLNGAYQQFKDLFGTKRFFISETGWPSAGETVNNAVASEQNAARYFIDFVSWAESGVQCDGYFYFEAFDEAWKRADEGERGAHWGIWDEAGDFKKDMTKVFEGWRSSSGVNNPFQFRITFVPPYNSSLHDVEGVALGVNPSDYRIAVYILVRGGWWTKPYWATPLTGINYDGRWACDVITGGVDSEFTEVAAYLVPQGYSPPLASGGQLPDSELRQHALAVADVLRQ